MVVMATYSYQHCGITQDIVASIKDTHTPPICAVCNAVMDRIYNTFGISFKGKGFYATDKSA